MILVACYGVEMKRLASLAIALGLVVGVSGCIPMRYDAQVGGYVPSRPVSYSRTPYYYYGGVPYYYSGGRYSYYSGGQRCYSDTLPWGGYYNHRHPVYPYRTYGGTQGGGWRVSGSWGLGGRW